MPEVINTLLGDSGTLGPVTQRDHCSVNCALLSSSVSLGLAQETSVDSRHIQNRTRVPPLAGWSVGTSDSASLSLKCRHQFHFAWLSEANEIKAD